MQVTETLAEGLKRAYTVVVPGTEVESRRAARFADLGKTVRLAGFRPGKVPLPVLRQRFGPAVTAEVIEQTVSETTRQLLSDRNLRPAGQPRVDLTTVEPAPDLEFKLELEILPEIPLPDFATIALTRLKAEVTDEIMASALDDIARRNRTTTQLSEEELGGRGAAKGELVTLDYTGRIDGTPFEGGSATDTEVEVASPGFIAGFAEQLEGLRPNETRTIEAQFPEGYGVAALAGKTAAFEVTVKAIGRRETPAITDEFAQKLSFESLDELKDMLRRRFQTEHDQQSRQRLKRDLLDRLNALATFPAPEGLVEAEFGQIWSRLEEDRKAGRLDADDQAKDEATLRDEYRAIADRRVRLGLLLSEVGRTHSITVQPEEMRRAIRAEASRYPGQESKVLEFFTKNPNAAEALRGPLFEDKVIDFVLELAQVSEQVVTPAALAADEPESAAEPAATEPAAPQPAPSAT